ncbi:hypothetical protein [Rhodanobacter sp. L36]|uniref:hypothetical protein n=1 Tax=Rhodanobacter sp. L36 TaxID=1747221 RepID=UPI00131AE5A6|nr:hypothetical protein [Rhodanobacter sp. L36]
MNTSIASFLRFEERPKTDDWSEVQFFVWHQKVHWPANPLAVSRALRLANPLAGLMLQRNVA